MTVFEAVQTRRSVRGYKDTPVEQEKIDKLLECVRLAPTAKNEQKHKVMVVTDPALRQKLMAASNNQEFVGQAPMILVICVTGERDMCCGQPARTIDGSIALSFIMLEAVELGLGTCWLGNFHADQAAEILGVPEDYRVIAMSTLGYPEGESRMPRRKELSEFAVYDSWK